MLLYLETLFRNFGQDKGLKLLVLDLVKLQLCPSGILSFIDDVG